MPKWLEEEWSGLGMGNGSALTPARRSKFESPEVLATEFALSGRIVPGKTRRVCEGVPLVGQGSGGSEAGLLDAGNQWLAFPKSIAFSDLGLVDC